MASFSAELLVAGHTYPVRLAAYEFTQATDQRGRVGAKTHAGLLRLTLDVPADDVLAGWAANPFKPLPGEVAFFAADQRTARESVRWEAGHCVGYAEEFLAGDTAAGAYVCHLAITTAGLTLHAGRPGTYVPPAPRAHGVPPAAVAGAAVASQGAAGVIARLPRITGRPPFTVKGPAKGKPGLDRAEFTRQLTGQQDGLNRLTVAEFLANRDRYLAQAVLTGDGRAPEGDAAQKAAREEALRDKTDELQDEDENLTRDEARALAEQWIETQAALHDPDQVAGGHAHLITGMGDARVNSSIGAQWPKRIKAIDQQIRKCAAGMTQQEQENTYLDIELPMV